MIGPPSRGHIMNQRIDRFPDLEDEDDAPIPDRPGPDDERAPTAPYAIPCADPDDPANR
jgi:hypothetical protein